MAVDNNPKTLLAYIIGTALEWYDFALFSSLAPVLSRLFFPSKNHIASLLAVFGVFATGFIMRPIGAVLFGHWGDTVGRKFAIMLAVFAMTIPTTLIGLLPTYQNIGIFAPILLIIMRMIQGLSASGEYPGAIVILAEISHSRQRALITSLSVMGVMIGMFLGSFITGIITSFCSGKTLYSLGWRIPFLTSIVLGSIGFYLRYKVKETPLFIEAMLKKQIEKWPVVLLYKQYKRNIALVIGVFVVNIVVFYTAFVYFPTYLVTAHKLNLSNILFINSANLLLAIVLLPTMGYLADRISKITVMTWGAVTLLLFSYPLFLLFEQQTIMSLFITQMFFIIFAVIFIAPVPSVAATLFPTKVKYSGVSLGLNIAASVFGGTAPFIATSLVYITKDPMSPCWYVIAVAIMGLLCVFKIKNQFNKENLSF